MPKTLTDIRSLARMHTQGAVDVLVKIYSNPKTGAAARVAAANSLLDRGWGKPAQVHTGDPDQPVVHKVIHEYDRPDSKSVGSIPSAGQA